MENERANADDVELITIGLTCYNAAGTIGRALTSAFAQDWPNIEILVVDDCSSDQSVSSVEAMIDTRTNARLVRHKQNTGPAGARNTIIEHARGTYIAFFDDDDESLPQRLSVQHRRLREYETANPSVPVACYASGERRYDNGYIKELHAIGSRGKHTPHGEKVADWLLLFEQQPDWFFGNGTPTCSLFIRRSTLIQIGRFDPTLRRVEDVDLAIRLALQGGHFVGTAEALFIQHSTSAPDKSAAKNLAAEQALAHKHRNYLQASGNFYYALHWPTLRYCHFESRYGRLLLELLGLFFRYPLRSTRHFLQTAPRRVLHEYKLRRRQRA